VVWHCLLFSSFILHPSSFLLAANVADEGPSSELAERYVADSVARLRLKAEIDLTARELRRGPGASQGSPAEQRRIAEITQMPLPSREALLGALESGSDEVLKALRQASARLPRDVDPLQTAWQSIRREINRGQFLLFQVKGSLRVAGQAASLLSVDKRWFWLFGVIAVASLLVVVLHDRRHELRRMFNGGRARAMGLSKILAAALAVLTVLALTTFVLEDHIYEWLLTLGATGEISPRQALVQRNADLAREVQELRTAKEKQERELSGAGRGVNPTNSTANAPHTPLPSSAAEFRREVAEIWTSLALLESLPRAIAADQAELKELRTELDRNTAATLRYLRLRQAIRGGLGVALLVLTAAGGFLFWQGVEQRRRVVAATCPLCLGQECLEPEPAAGVRGPAAVATVKCHNVVSRHPREECNYAFAAAYRSMQKLCFPTLGVPQAGKTHWLSMIYWELNRGNYPKAVQFEKAKSRTSEDFDILVEEILTSRIGTAATQRERIPRPLVFNFRDRDRWSRSNLLVNIFDYSGEVTADMGVDDYRRRRALEADGYFFFLDPTFPTEPQMKALNDFREDLRLVKGVKSGRSIRAPVALCVTKIDLLANQAYALPGGNDAIGRFYDQLAHIDPSGESLRLGVLEARSRLTARLRETIWPGWQIERQVHDLFGGRYMFFPLTPVGLDGRGETDLSLRTISPFGLLEPLLWLLQMNGYPVLE
jgi:hypothetical protein